MIRALVDCVAFQQGTSVRELWQPVIAWLAKQLSLEILLLDRGRAPAIAGVTVLPFPAHLGNFGAADSLLVQRFCDRFSVDVFISTGSTSPVTTPSALFVPSSEIIFSESPEDQASLSYAQRYLCHSREVLASLLAEFPETPASHAVVCSGDPRTIALELESAARALSAEARSGAYEAFFADWKRIREIQAAVEWLPAPPGRMRIEQASTEGQAK